MYINLQRGYLQILYSALQRPKSERPIFFEHLRAFMEHRIPLEFGSTAANLQQILELIDLVEGTVQ